MHVRARRNITQSWVANVDPGWACVGAGNRRASARVRKVVSVASLLIAVRSLTAVTAIAAVGAGMPGSASRVPMTVELVVVVPAGLRCVSVPGVALAA